MMLFFCSLPVLLLFVLVGLFIYCKKTDGVRKEKAGHAYYNHPDKDLPLYNCGHCDRYSVGTFYW